MSTTNTKTMFESFKWIPPEFTTEPVKEGVRIRGKAICAAVTSLNKRYYAGEGLKEGTGTFEGRPITVNHAAWDRNNPRYNPKLIAGHVEQAFYEDGCIEYLAIVKNEPYVSMLRSKSAEIRGVSVEADYLFNQCPDCNERYFTKETFKKHMQERHFKRNMEAAPFGIRFRALSLVLAPETPGVPGTTLEVMETAQKGALELLETVARNEMEKEKHMQETSGIATTKDKRMAVGHFEPAKAGTAVAVEQTKPTLEHVSPTVTNQEQKPVIATPETVKLSDKETEKTSAQHKPPTEMPTLQKLKTPEKLAAAEACDWGSIGYSSFEDCVSSNGDKADPEGYCASIMRNAKGETVERRKVAEALNVLAEAVQTIEQNLQVVTQQLYGAITAVPADDKSWEGKIKELAGKLEQETAKTVAMVEQKITETLEAFKADEKKFAEELDTRDTKFAEALVNSKDDLTWKDALETFRTEYKKLADTTDSKFASLETDNKKLAEDFAASKKDFETVLASADKNIVETRKTLEERIKELEVAKAALENKVKESTEKKLEETEAIDTRVTNIEETLGKGKFKGKNRDAVKKLGEPGSYAKPYA